MDISLIQPRNRNTRSSAGNSNTVRHRGHRRGARRRRRRKLRRQISVAQHAQRRHKPPDKRRQAQATLVRHVRRMKKRSRRHGYQPDSARQQEHAQPRGQQQHGQARGHRHGARRCRRRKYHTAAGADKPQGTDAGAGAAIAQPHAVHRATAADSPSLGEASRRRHYSQCALPCSLPSVPETWAFRVLSLAVGEKKLFFRFSS